MSNRSVVGYRTPEGEFRGTYVHAGSDSISRDLHAVVGFDAGTLRVWVENGIENAGYPSVLLPPYGDDDEPHLYNIETARKARFPVFEILENGSVIEI